MNVEKLTRSTAREPHEPLRRVFRAVLSLLVSLVGIDFLWHHIATTLSGKTDVVGYPLYANFNVNRYLDAFYLISIIGPVSIIVIYAVLARFGPLKRTTPSRTALRSEIVLDGDEQTRNETRALNADEETSSRVVASPLSGVFHIARIFFVGALLGAEIATASGPGALSVMAVMAISGAALVVLVLPVAQIISRVTKNGTTWEISASKINSFIAIAAVGLIYPVSRSTQVLVASSGQVVRYPWLPLWLVIVIVSLLIAYIVHRLHRADATAEHIEQRIIFFVAIPVAIFISHAVILGALGGMDVFGEGEYLAGGWLMMHGLLPWRDLYLIHGVFDDGFKSIIGYQIFGRTRWGATTGISVLLAPLYWVATYYFAAVVFFRRPYFVIAAAASVSLGVFVDWDLRYLFWPLVLVLLYRVLQQRTPTRVVLFVGALILQAILIPELSYAFIACAVTLVAFELYERSPGRLSLFDLRATLWSLVTGAIVGGAFIIWLVSVHALGGFIGYFENFANAHSLTGGIPLYTTYANATATNAFGITLHLTASPPLFTRYGYELFLPVVAILATIGLVCTRVRGGRRLVTQDWLCIASALLVALYYQKGISRADAGHLAEVFEVTVPLLLLLAYRLTIAIEHAVARLPQGSRLLSKNLSRGSVSFVTLVIVLVVAPASIPSLFDPMPAHFRATVASPAPPSPVAGGPGLGYSVDAIAPGVVSDIGKIFDRYAGKAGAVFDFSNAPAVVYFLLNKKPVSRFYDVGDIETPTAQQNAISDLIRTEPVVVLFNGIGMGTWDFIPNEIRDPILSDWLLSHYRPLVMVNGQLLLIHDTITKPKPLPRLSIAPRTRSLYLSLGQCAWGYIPNFLNIHSAKDAQPRSSVTLTRMKSTPSGTIYRFIAPESLRAYHWISVTVIGTHRDVGLSIANVAHHSLRDISWVQQGSGTSEVEVASCLQWHGFGRVLYLRYLGQGHPNNVELIG